MSCFIGSPWPGTSGKAGADPIPVAVNDGPAAQTQSPHRPRKSILQQAASALLHGGAPGTDQASQPLRGEQTQVAVNERGEVDLHVSNMDLAEVLRLLAVQSHRNITATPDVTGTVTASLFGVSFEEALDAILMSNGAGYRKAGKFIYVYTLEELAEMDAAAGEKPVTRVLPLNYIAAEDASKYVEPLLSKVGNVVVSPAAESGLLSDPTKAGGNANAGQDFIIVTDRPTNLREIERVLRSIDVRPVQVLIEATILRAELTDDNALGIDFTVVGGVDLQDLGTSSNALTDYTPGQLPDERFELFNALAMTGFTNNVPGGGLTLGVLKDKVAVFISALEEVTDTTVVANPKVLVLNKQKGQVIVGRRDGFFTTTVTETQAIQTVEYLETGTTLLFRPFVTDDGWIRVELHPEDSVGFVNAQGLPSEQTTEVTTNVIVRDGETILIGGLFREVTTASQSQIPALGNLPVIGPLFRSNNDSTAREEVVILLTIHVVRDHGRYVEESRAAMEDVERLRVGMRHGMMWHGRDRIAQSHYRKALDAVSEHDTKKALYHLNLALHNNYHFLPAIKLKEKILGERAWDEDGAMQRDFMHRLIAPERGFVPPMYARPAPLAPAPVDENVKVSPE